MNTVGSPHFSGFFSTNNNNQHHEFLVPIATGDQSGISSSWLALLEEGIAKRDDVIFSNTPYVANEAFTTQITAHGSIPNASLVTPQNIQLMHVDVYGKHVDAASRALVKGLETNSGRSQQGLPTHYETPNLNYVG